VRGKLVRLFTVFVSSIEARQPRAAVDRYCSSHTRPSQLKEHNTLKSLCRRTKMCVCVAQQCYSTGVKCPTGLTRRSAGLDVRSLKQGLGFMINMILECTQW
jgi:hypothetical protein